MGPVRENSRYLYTAWPASAPLPQVLLVPDLIIEWQDNGGESKRRQAAVMKGALLLTTGLFLVFLISRIGRQPGSPTDANAPRSVWSRLAPNATRILHQQSGRLTADKSGDVSELNIADHSYVASLWATRKNPSLSEVSCRRLFEGDSHEVARARQIMTRSLPPPKKPEQEFTFAAQNCESFRRDRGYIMQPLSKEEYEFPIAFSLLMYDDVEQVERLLRAVYAPQNFYCIHVDLKAADSIHIAVRSIARCFPNVFVASRLESVYWGHISIMYAEMNCLTDLLQYQWKYFINLSGQMFPLHTNRELVKVLKLYDGANDIEGTYKKTRHFNDLMRQAVRWRLYESLDMMLMSLIPKGSAPYNVTIFKGSNQVAISRAFAEYFLTSPLVSHLIQWFSDTLVPDEYIWSTINHNPHLLAPGGYKGDPDLKPFVSRVSIWGNNSHQVNWSWDYWECQGKWVREICIFGVGDMPWLYHRPELFANKFHSKFEWLAYDCMEELLFNRTLAGDQIPFDSSYYEKLPFVKHKELVITAEDARGASLVS